MGNVYASVSDITALRSLTAQQQEAAEVLLSEASAMLRVKARQYGKSIDAMIADSETGEDFGLAVKSVVVQAVCRALDAYASEQSAVTQASETLGPYSYTYHYADAGQALYFRASELKMLGLKQQKIGFVDLYGTAGGGG